MQRVVTRARIAWTSFALALLAAACSSSDPRPPPTGYFSASDASNVVDAGRVNDGEPSDGAPDDADAGDADPARCNTLTHDTVAAPVDVINLMAPLPPAAGGALVNGTYRLTAVRYHNELDAGVDGTKLAIARRTTIQITGTTMEQFYSNPGGLDPEVRSTATLELSGTGAAAKLKTTGTCHYANEPRIPLIPVTYGYTATATTLTIYPPLGGGDIPRIDPLNFEGNGTGYVEAVFTKQ
jgi:hypothetical protein